MAKFDPDAFLGTAEPTEKKKRGFDPDAFLAAPQPVARETAAQTFGRSAASAADSALNAITGTLDYGAYALARAAGRNPQQATAETTSPKDVFGRAFGVTGTPGYEQAPLRRLGTAVGETVGQNVIQPVAQATGIAEQDVGNMLNSLAMGVAPVAGRATAATGRGVRAAAQVPVDVAKGAAGRATGYIARPGETPTGYQVPSSRIPLGDTFIPAKEMAELQRGMPISEGAVRPISELAPGPVLALSGGEIPVAGQAARAFGERVGETYANPYTAAADIGSMFLTGGIPVLTAGRGALGLAQAGADAYLARKGFTGLTPEQRTALNQGTNPFYTAPAAGPVRPQPQAPAPAPQVTAQPVAPAEVPRLEYNPTQPVMYASETGIVGKTPNEVIQADLAQRYAPQPVAPVAAAAPEMPPAPTQSDINKQNVMDMIRAKRAQPTVAPTELPAAPVAQAVATPSEQVMAAVPDLAKKSHAEIRFDIKNSAKAGVTTKNNVVQLDKAVFNDLAAQYGATINWDNMPKLKNGAADAREQVRKFVWDEIKGTVGPEKRGPQQRTLAKEAWEEQQAAEQARLAALTPEERAAEIAKQAERDAAAEKRAKEGFSKLFPTNKTNVQPQAAGTISPALQALLDKQKAAGKYKPPGVSEMITDEPSAIQKIQSATWDTPEEFANKTFMHDLGLNPGQEFIAKTKTENGSIIRAVEAGVDSTAAQFPDKTGVLIKKNATTGETVYNVFDDGINYDFVKTPDGVLDFADIYTVDKNGDRLATVATKDEYGWTVIEKNAKGSYIVRENEINYANATTKEKMKALQSQDWDAFLQSWQNKIDLIKGK
jgi:hypothetical protein